MECNQRKPPTILANSGVGVELGKATWTIRTASTLAAGRREQQFGRTQTSFFNQCLRLRLKERAGLLFGLAGGGFRARTEGERWKMQLAQEKGRQRTKTLRGA